MITFRKIALLIGLLAAMALTGVGQAAAAVIGYVTVNLNLRAGPGSSYPVVATMRAGDEVTIYGCLSGWRWCDINWKGHRGWAAGKYLRVSYEHRLGPITTYGPYIGLPFIVFNLDSYWDRYYDHYPFFKHKHHHKKSGPGPVEPVLPRLPKEPAPKIEKVPRTINVPGPAPQVPAPEGRRRMPIESSDGPMPQSLGPGERQPTVIEPGKRLLPGGVIDEPDIGGPLRKLPQP